MREEHRVQQVRLEPPGNQEDRDLRELKETLDQLDKQVNQVHKVSQERRVLKAPRAVQGLLAQPVHRVR